MSCIKNNEISFFKEEKKFIDSWKKSFNPYIFNESYLKIFFIKKLSQSLDKLCSHYVKEHIHYLSFIDIRTARIAYEELNFYNLNWSKKLDGKLIEIVIYNHTGESKNNLQLVLNKFFNDNKNAYQAKRNKLIKQNIDNKKQIDTEVKYMNALIYVDINKMK